MMFVILVEFDEMMTEDTVVQAAAYAKKMGLGARQAARSSLNFWRRSGRRI